MVDYDVDELELNGEYKCAFCKRWGIVHTYSENDIPLF